MLAIPSLGNGFFSFHVKPSLIIKEIPVLMTFNTFDFLKRHFNIKMYKFIVTS